MKNVFRKKSHRLVVALCAITFSFITLPTQAALISVLGGLAFYDDAADLTWLADANAAKTLNYDQDGKMTTVDAATWLAGLNVSGVTGWRLAVTLRPDSGCNGIGGGTDTGYGCSGSELGNMFYNVLGGQNLSLIADVHNANYDLFTNIQSDRYWSSTQSQYNPTWQDYFNSKNMYQSSSPTVTHVNYVWAVKSGNVSALPVPVPPTVWLFGIGLVVMGWRKAA